MDLSEAFLRVAVFLFPGLLSAYIVEILTIHRPWTQFRLLVNAVILGVASYIMLWIVQASIGSASSLELLDVSVVWRSNEALPTKLIAWAAGSGIAVGLFVTASSTYGWHVRIAQRLRISRKFGALDVWGFVFNSPQVEWATVRDHAHGLVYDGWVNAFSDTSAEAELLLGDVKIYRNDTGEHLYSVPYLYLSLEKTSIAVEFRGQQSEQAES